MASWWVFDSNFIDKVKKFSRFVQYETEGIYKCKNKIKIKKKIPLVCCHRNEFDG